MSVNSWKLTLLLIAIMVATLRPMVASNSQAESCLFGRCGGTESEEEREGGERDSETDQDVNVESQRTRRVSHHIRKPDLLLHLVRATSPSLSGSASSGRASAGEHAFRFGIGAPLRI